MPKKKKQTWVVKLHGAVQSLFVIYPPDLNTLVLVNLPVLLHVRDCIMLHITGLSPSNQQTLATTNRRLLAVLT